MHISRLRWPLVARRGWRSLPISRRQVCSCHRKRPMAIVKQISEDWSPDNNGMHRIGQIQAVLQSTHHPGRPAMLIVRTRSQDESSRSNNLHAMIGRRPTDSTKCENHRCQLLDFACSPPCSSPSALLLRTLRVPLEGVSHRPRLTPISNSAPELKSTSM